MELPLLSTKNAVPLLPAQSVRRPRLIERVNQGAQGLLTLVTAPAWFGKTSLMVEWARQTPHAVAWLTLERFPD